MNKAHDNYEKSVEEWRLTCSVYQRGQIVRANYKILLPET